jgi:ABC-type transport system substrate-binding protein
VSTANPNPTGWKNTQYDADIADAKATLDPNKRTADFRDALKQFYTDFPTMYVDHSTYYLYGAPALQDIDMSGNGMDLLDRMWLKTHS